jgi:uncharacterized protein
MAKAILFHSHNKMTKKQYISYDDVSNVIMPSIFRQLANDEFKPDVIVGLTRGGLVPAVHCSHYYDVPMVTLHFALRDHPREDDIDEIERLVNSGKRVLIVDEICDGGHTLRKIHDVLFASYQNMVTAAPIDTEVLPMQLKYAVMVHNLACEEFEPDYWGMTVNKMEDPVWLVYPWEY